MSEQVETAKEISKNDTLGAFLAKQKNQLQAALPKHMNVDRMLRIALTEVRKTPALTKCTKESFYSALLQSGQLGIEPGGSLGHGYLIPYGNECKFMLGYRGMIDLARRTGEIISICARVVNENDDFVLKFGLEEKLEHTPAQQNAGKMTLVYAIAHLQGGGHQFEVMTKEEVDAIRKRSKTSTNGPWVTDYNEMARKTVVRKLFKYLPVSIELRDQLDKEDEKDFIEGECEIVSTSKLQNKLDKNKDETVENTKSDSEKDVSDTATQEKDSFLEEYDSK